MGRVIAIANQKGGVGKSTTAINLSACLSEKGEHVLTIDIDPQGNTTSGLGIDKASLEKTLYELLMGDADRKDVIVHSPIEELPLLDVIPSNVNLSGAEIELFELERNILLRQSPISLRKSMIILYLIVRLHLVFLQLMLSARQIP